MKLAGLINLIYLLPALGQKLAGDACDSMNTRIEFRSASDEQRKVYFDTFRKWAEMKGSGSLSHFSWIHDINEATSHNVPCFLPWHRKFLKLAENALRKINPDFIMLYWDWTKDARTPHTSPVWDERYLGKNGRGSERIVRDGAFAGVVLQHPYQHLLKRDWDLGTRLSSFPPPQSIKMILEGSRNFEQFWEGIEDSPHAVPHDTIGGDQGDGSTMYSPNDGFFWLHHAFIDMLWWSWQQINPKMALDYYNRPTEQMRPWNSPVSEWLDTRKYPACTQYDRVFDYQLPNADTNRARAFFSNVSRRKKTSTQTTIEFSSKSSKRTYISIKAKNIAKIAEDIAAGDLPSFNVDSDDSSAPPEVLFTPRPISEKFVKMNHMNLTKIREFEELNKNQIQAINAVLAMENPDINNYFIDKQEKEDQA